MGHYKTAVIKWMNAIGKDPLDANKTDYTLFTLMNCARPVFTGRYNEAGEKIFTDDEWVSIGDFLDNQCGTRYGARIHTLRHKFGYSIESKKIHKSHYYRLV